MANSGIIDDYSSDDENDYKVKRRTTKDIYMSFIQHIACPKCGSKNNLGEYTDHYYCFGCGYHKLKNDLQSVRQRLAGNSEPAQTGDQSLVISDDIPKEPMKWLLSYGFVASDVSEYSWGWCADKQMLVLVNLPTYYQGRNFGKGTKYLSKGDKPLLFYNVSDTIVCVEDILSAAKISKANKDVSAVPLLGSSISNDLEQTLIERAKQVIIWLDRDKATYAVKQARRLIERGVSCSVLVTELDPKEYSLKEINEWLKSKL